MKTIVWITILLAAPLAGCNRSSNSVIHSSNCEDTYHKLTCKIDSIVARKMTEYEIPGLAIGIVRNDSVLYLNGYGVKSIDEKKAVETNSVFHTASVSKLFTAQAIMLLIEEGKLTLDDRLTEIVPNLEYHDQKVESITIKHLLNHTSGLPDVDNYHWELANEGESSLQDYILGLDLKLRSAPGQEYYYSNLAYDILGYVIQKASGRSFEEYLKDEVLTKSGMLQSDFRYFEISRNLRVSPHTKRKISGNVYERPIYPYTREHAPSSTLNASSEELARWMISFLQKVSEEDSNLNQMLQPSFSGYENIGLGFQLYDFGQFRGVGHFGGDKGFRSFLMMIPDQRLGLVLLGNCDYNEDYRQEILLPIAKMLLSNVE